MYLSVVLLFVVHAFLPFASAGKLACGQACQEALSYLDFTGTDPSAGYYESQCSNKLRVQSVYICIRHYCTPRENKAALVDFNRTCEEYGEVFAPPYNIIADISEKGVTSLPKVGVANYTSTEELNTAVFPLEELYDIAKRTIDTWADSEVTRAIYGYAMYGFWGSVLLIGIVNRVAAFGNAFLQRRRMHSARHSKHQKLNRLQLWTRYRFTTPAMCSRRTAEPIGWCTVPPRIQSLTIAAYVLINVVLCCVNYDLFPGNTYWGSTRVQLSRYLADRTGVLAFANLPILWTFGLRNNVLMWLTNWNFSTYSMFHRWVARVTTLEAIVHGISYSAEVYIQSGQAVYYSHWTRRYWWCGAVAVVSMSFICGFSIQPMRQHLYEIFLAVHIALAVVVMATLWYHVEIFDGEYNGYIWPCVAVWVFDRSSRIIRLVILNLPYRKSILSYDPAADVIRLDFQKPQLLKPKPGTYYYIYFLHGLKFWESHPFTLSSWSDGRIVNPSFDVKNRTPDTQPTWSFIIRPHDSFTNRICKSVMQQQIGDTTGKTPGVSLRVMLEGPYGHHIDLKRYESLLFVVGGTGITVALSHLCDLFLPGGNHRPTIQLVWAVRDVALLQNVVEKDLDQWLSSSELQDRFRLEVQVYVTTGPTSPGSTDGSAETSGLSSPDAKGMYMSTRGELSSKAGRGNSSVRLVYKRPDILEAVTQAVDQHASEGGVGKLAVVSCGPQRMADDVRAAVVKMLGEGHEDLDFFPESFGW